MIKALHHIQLAMPEGGEDLAREFYAGRLGLLEVPKPQVLASRGGVWFERGEVRVHLGVEAEFIAARKAHPAFQVTDLTRARVALAEASPTEVSTLPGLKRFYVADPFGNRIEIVERS